MGVILNYIFGIYRIHNSIYWLNVCRFLLKYSYRKIFFQIFTFSGWNLCNEIKAKNDVISWRHILAATSRFRYMSLFIFHLSTYGISSKKVGRKFVIFRITESKGKFDIAFQSSKFIHVEHGLNGCNFGLSLWYLQNI